MKKLSKGVYICSWIAIIISFYLKIFGSSAFDIDISNPMFLSIANFIDNNLFFKITIPLLSYVISNVLIIMSIIRRKLNLKETLFIIPSLIVICLVSSIINNEIVFFIKMVLEIGLMVLMGLREKSGISHTIRIIVINLAYQIISLVTKNLGIQFTAYGTCSQLILMIDYYLLLVNLYIRESSSNVRWLVVSILLSYKECERKWLYEVQETYQNSFKNEIRKDKLDKILKPLYLVGLAIFQFGMVLGIGFLINNTLINIIYIIISFFIVRVVLGKNNSWHANTIMACTSSTALSFAICSKLALPLGQSILINVVIGSCLAYAMYMLYNYFNNEKQIKLLEEELKQIREEKETLNINSMSKEEMKETFKHLKEWEINLFYDFINKGSRNVIDIARKHNYSVMQMYRIVKRIKKSL